jgi:hypothetical protein
VAVLISAQQPFFLPRYACILPHCDPDRQLLTFLLVWHSAASQQLQTCSSYCHTQLPAFPAGISLVSVHNKLQSRSPYVADTHCQAEQYCGEICSPMMSTVTARQHCEFKSVSMCSAQVIVGTHASTRTGCWLRRSWTLHEPLEMNHERKPELACASKAGASTLVASVELHGMPHQVAFAVPWHQSNLHEREILC